MILVAAASEDGPGMMLDPADALSGRVKAAQGGDPAAFEDLVIRHERSLLRLAYRMLGDLEEAKDASQEVLVRFHRYLRNLDPDRDPSPWLHQMMVNVCRDLYRSRGRLQVVSLETTPEQAHFDPDAHDPGEGLDQERRITALSRAIAHLPPKERAALVLRDVEGRSAAEAAQMLGSSEVTVRSQACRGRVRLKKLLEGIL